MFVILVYDAGEKRVQKFHKACKKFLHWVQLSVFEGELSKAQLEQLKFELKALMKPEEDSVIIYTFRTRHYFSREVMGKKKGDPDSIFV
ncbi:CRISPR-associated protein Cas2 [Thermodesulfatator indicus DSM 15286]|uniref:CRISPR-associated endoribonuclease Cas2 n=1 Tax=Thermodesulfatator indicus (strain DSM 15286 / JCM 11887 / CIR29812) TaxID=667014 RepID=F8A9H3_THEID|nr:CRISPR-associated endonuclease Cas2 [Thermodesulfatator indicus]AEH44118.1 CRISPR-associated protein Cas2 [Thermodesulfatator indicus DSM 15286]